MSCAKMNLPECIVKADFPKIQETWSIQIEIDAGHFLA